MTARRSLPDSTARPVSLAGMLALKVLMFDAVRLVRVGERGK